MKTKSEVELIKERVSRNIESFGELARKANQNNDQYNFEHYDREYAKATAQYNILLEVLK